jgi:hypothetical protein
LPQFLFKEKERERIGLVSREKWNQIRMPSNFTVYIWGRTCKIPQLDECMDGSKDWKPGQSCNERTMKSPPQATWSQTQLGAVIRFLHPMACAMPIMQVRWWALAHPSLPQLRRTQVFLGLGHSWSMRGWVSATWSRTCWRSTHAPPPWKRAAAGLETANA